MYTIRLILTGIIIGMANVIPGVSGGTLAVVFNIYDKFVNAITLNIKKLKANWKFIVPLLGGMAGGVLLFSKMITFLYGRFPVQTNFCFTGLILGSMPLIFGKIINRENEEKQFSMERCSAVLACIFIGTAVLLFFSWLNVQMGNTKDVSPIMPDFTWPLAFKIFIAGILGAITMIIPGISGSLIMLIMGVYTIVITSIPALFNPDTFWHALILLLPNGIGVIIGLLCGAKLVSFLLKKAPRLTYAVIFGLLIGSAIDIFPGFSSISTVGGYIGCILSCLFGIALAYLTARFAPEENSSDKKEEETETN